MKLESTKIKSYCIEKITKLRENKNKAKDKYSKMLVFFIFLNLGYF